MKQFKWTRWLGAVGMSALLISGCSSWKSNEVQSIDPPPPGIHYSPGGEVQTVAAELTPSLPVTLYFKNPQGMMTPVSVQLPKVEWIARQSLEYMVDGGPGAQVLPRGFQAVLPKGTEVKGMNIIQAEKLAVVDFSEQFTSYNAQDERKILEAVTWTLTGFPAIEKVQIWVEGAMLKEMPVAGTPLDEPLTRALGINIERGSGVDYGQSMPVTLYFPGQGEDSYQYYVPVTRLVKRSDNVAMAAVEQLIAGPEAARSGGLLPVMAPTAKVVNLQLSDDRQLITVNFDHHLLGPDQRAQSEAIQSVILSLTENTGASHVQIMIDGAAQVQGTDNQNYSQPVARPGHVNPYKL